MMFGITPMAAVNLFGGGLVGTALGYVVSAPAAMRRSVKSIGLRNLKKGASINKAVRNHRLFCLAKMRGIF